MESFLSQETEYEFEIVVGDGGSIDANREILKDYQKKYGGEKIRLLFPEQDPGIGSMLNQIFLTCKGKYIAVCEGDDYWTDRNKLQFQVSFLEQNPSFSLIHSEITFINEKGELLSPDKTHLKIKKKRKDGFVFDHLSDNGNFIYTPTVCFRKSGLPNEKLLQKETWYLFDYWYWLLISLHGKFYFQQTITAVYRRHKAGVTQRKVFFSKKYRSIHKDVIMYYLQKNGFSSWSASVIKTYYILLIDTRDIKEMLHLLTILIRRPLFAVSLMKFAIVKKFQSKN